MALFYPGVGGGLSSVFCHGDQCDGVTVCGSQCGFIGIKRLTNHWITLELELVISATLHHPGHSGPRHKLLMARNEMFTQIMVTPPQWETEKGNVLYLPYILQPLSY